MKENAGWSNSKHIVLALATLGIAFALQIGVTAWTDSNGFLPGLFFLLAVMFWGLNADARQRAKTAKQPEESTDVQRLG